MTAVSVQTGSHADEEGASVEGQIQTTKSFDWKRASWIASAVDAVVHIDGDSPASGTVGGGSDGSDVDMSFDLGDLALETGFEVKEG